MMRIVGRLAAVGAIALILAGSAVVPAAARDRSDVVWSVNYAIGVCVGGGGDPFVTEHGNEFILFCVFEDGNQFTSEWTYEDDD